MMGKKSIEIKLKRTKLMWTLILVLLMLSLTACSSTPTATDESANAPAEPNVNESTTTTTAAGETNAPAESTTETAKASSSDWVTGVIGGDVEITNVFAVGDGLIGIASMNLYYSADGITWEMTKDLSPYPFYGVFPVGGQVVVYDAGNAHVTSDGQTWTSSPRDDSHLFNAAMHDGKQYIKVDTSQLYTSEDGGKFWPVQGDPSNPLTKVFFLDDDGKPTNIMKLAQFGGTYYAAGPGLWTSTDLYNWTKVVTMNDITYGAEDLLYNGSVLFMPAFYENYIYDGSGITSVKPIGNTFLVHDGKFIAASGTGASSTSADGITWEPLFGEDTAPFHAYTSVVFDGKLFVYGEDGQYRYAELGE